MSETKETKEKAKDVLSPGKMPVVQGKVEPTQSPEQLAGSARFRQRYLGNNYLMVSQPGDKYEQEADRIADLVMQMPEPAQSEQSEEKNGSQKKGKISNRITPLIQAQQPNDHPVTVTDELVSQIHALEGSGQPLPEVSRFFFESRIGHNFNQVRIHNDAQSVNMARTFHSRAFTVGNNIVFGANEYAPETASGKQLLGHELTHVAQQSKGVSPAIRLSLSPSKFSTAPDVDFPGEPYVNECGCLIEPIAQKTGRYPCHADFAKLISGVSREIRVKTPDGRKMKDFDALTPDGVLYEVKTGYGWITNSNLSPYWQTKREEVINSFIDQSEDQIEIANRCGYPLIWCFNNKAVAEYFDVLIQPDVEYRAFDCDVDSDESNSTQMRAGGTVKEKEMEDQEKIKNVTVEESAEEITKQINDLVDQIGLQVNLAGNVWALKFKDAINLITRLANVEIDSALRQIEINRDHLIVSYWSEYFGEVKLPSAAGYKDVLSYLKSARECYEEALKRPTLNEAVDWLDAAFRLVKLSAYEYNSTHQKWQEYRRKIIKGAEIAIDRIEVAIMILSSAAGGIEGIVSKSPSLLFKFPSLLNYSMTQVTVAFSESAAFEIGKAVILGDEIDVLDIIENTGVAFISSLVGGKLSDLFYGKLITTITASGITPPRLRELFLSRMGRNEMEKILKIILDRLRGKNASSDDVVDEIVKEITKISIDTLTSWE